MKKEVRYLREKAINSLVLTIEYFNRPWDRGREEAVLLMLNHAFEMLLKAAIIHRGGEIRKLRERRTIGFEACVRKAVSNTQVKFLNEEQAVTLQAINGQRDAVQHYFVHLSERQLYIYAQAGVTLFRDVHDRVFQDALSVELPERVLPVSTAIPLEVSAVFEREINEIRLLLESGQRYELDARSRARSIALLEGAINGDYEQPSDEALGEICARLADRHEWPQMFPGVASIGISESLEGPTHTLRLTKSEGPTVDLTGGNGGHRRLLVERRVNELDVYSLGAKQLAQKVGLTPPKCRAVIDHRHLERNPELFKLIKIGGMKHARYSPKAIRVIEETLETESIDEIWSLYREKQKRKQREKRQRQQPKYRT